MPNDTQTAPPDAATPDPAARPAPPSQRYVWIGDGWVPRHTGVELIAAALERDPRSAAVDDRCTDAELTRAAVYFLFGGRKPWPWPGPPPTVGGDRAADLAAAGALIAAEIDRLSRAAAATLPRPTGGRHRA